MSPATCPHCLTDTERLAGMCATCGGDLEPFVRLDELADAWFNRALAAGQAEDWSAAAEHLAVNLALRPDDADAWLLLGKVRVRQKRLDLARAACAEAARLAPLRSDVRDACSALQAIDAIDGPG
jgi:tetratricopeptide (TPR) repeat protein